MFWACSQLKIAEMHLLTSPCLYIHLTACNLRMAEEILMTFYIGEFTKIC
jgi:hypothetical protein